MSETQELTRANNILRTQTLTDHATGLWNRRYLDVVLDKEIERMMRFESNSLKLLMFDIDNYKKVNDSLGHKFGDLLAVEFADMLKRIFRSSDYIFRVGGDEYIVLMRDAGDETIDATTKRLRTEITELIIEEKEVGSLIDISIGFSSFDYTRPYKEMLHEADVRMYEEKNRKKIKTA